MTAVLLIADSERVQRVFADLESRGVLQLRAAAALDQVEQKLLAASPAFTFLQSGISGLATGILLRHLKKSLPENSKIILLSGDAAELQPGRSSAIPILDLRAADDVLAETVTGIVTGKGTTSRAGGRITAKEKVAAKKTPRQKGSPRTDGAKGEEADAQVPDPKQRAASPPVPGVELSFAGAAATAEPIPESHAGAPAVAAPPAPHDFSEMMAAASARIEMDSSLPLDVEDQVRIGEGGGRAHKEAPASELAQPARPREPGSVPHAQGSLTGPGRATQALPAGGKRSQTLWLFLLLLALFLIPSTAYLAGRVSTAAEQETRQLGDGVAGQRSPLVAAAISARAPNSSRAAAETAQTGAPAHEAADVSGLAILPPFLEGVEVDSRYGDRHPGWERYLGAKAEYKLFREGGRYRAIQAIARADEIPDQLFRRVLLEFGGIAGYAVSSAEEKGDYLVEQATGSGSASLTIYRKRQDARIKGLVVYYR